MGSLFNIVIYSSDSTKAANAAARAYRLLDTLNDIYSDYLPTSELNRLCAEAGNGKWIAVSEPLYSILTASYKAGLISRGSFDITMGPLVRLWRTARQKKAMPDADSLRSAKRRVGFRNIKFDPVNKAVKLEKPGMLLDLGGVAKGESAQRVLTCLRDLGYPYSLVDAGGDIVAGAVPAGVAGWIVSVNMPGSEEVMNRQLVLQNKAVTTSGDLYQYVELNGRRFSHIINPFTGYALTNSRNVTVISNAGIDADWLTKACSILSIRKATRLIRRFPSAEVQIAFLRAGKPIFYRSPGFTAYFQHYATFQ